MRTRTALPVAALALVTLGSFALWYFSADGSAHAPATPPPTAPATEQSTPRTPPAQPSPAGPSPAQPPAASAERLPEAAPEGLPAPARSASSEEEELMVVLRHSWPVDPLGSLEEAKAADERFPKSPHAPERGWIVVRSLVELKRFQEARDEAARLVARFPNNSWASDVQRHLLVHPLGQPSREAQQK